MPSKISEAISSLPVFAKAPTGASTGNGGAERQLTGSLETARAWLADKSPAEVDAALVTSLRSSLSVELIVKREWRFPEGKTPYSVSTTTGVKAPSKANIERAISRIEMAMTPVTRQNAEEMVAQLSAATAMRSESEEMNEVKLDLYVDCLLRHPADVAREAIRQFAVEPRKGTAWFPTLPEVEHACRNLSGDRLSFLFGLKAWKEPDPQVEAVKALERDWRRLSTETTELLRKVGPGPAADEGPRGERIAAWKASEAAATAAREKWAEAKKACGGGS